MEFYDSFFLSLPPKKSPPVKKKITVIYKETTKVMTCYIEVHVLANVAKSLSVISLPRIFGLEKRRFYRSVLKVNETVPLTK